MHRNILIVTSSIDQHAYSPVNELLEGKGYHPITYLSDEVMAGRRQLHVSIDIEDPDGRIVFLECNPNGQYGWLEEQLGFPISQAIAGELIKIAKNG